jgi:hypothetical protein
MKKILIVGVLDKPESTNVAMKKGFEQLGFTVDSYNYRTVLSQVGLQAMWADYGKFIDEHGKDYDLAIFCKTNQLHPNLITFTRKFTKTWYWFMDPMATAKQVYSDTFARAAEYCSATSSQVHERHSLVNNNSHHIIEGYDPDFYYYEDLPKEYDFVFIGNATPKRVRDLQWFLMPDHKKPIYDVKVFGAGWPEYFKASAGVYLGDERNVINKAKIVINLCHDEYMFSDRVTKALGCKARVLTQHNKDFRDLIVNAFDDDKNKKLGEDIDHALWYCMDYDYEADTLFTEPAFRVVFPKNTDLWMKEHFSWKNVCKVILGKCNVTLDMA